ncbi:hypothetical protein M3Y97_00863000 [Aphelenchoides bicaudatus]|nr:hypothetical protein M3Y97_00863000 [Aphelenchoides bicaudatus]
MALNLTLVEDFLLENTTSPVVKGPLTGIFDGIDFGLNSRSFHQLLTALVAILVISAVVIAAIILFRCYMIYCKSYANTNVYQLPMYRRSVRNSRPNRRRRRTLAFFWRGNNSEEDQNGRETYTFQTIFEDPPE